MSKIEWTEETWNPLIGCSKVSPGCKNCYAIQTAWIRQHNPKMAERYAGVVEKTSGGSLNWTGKVNFVNEAIDKPLRKKKPTMYFVNSMSDLFHEAVPFEYIDKVFAVMGRCQHHIFQVLTKRPDRMLEYYKSDPYQRILNHAYQLDLPKGHSLGAGIDNPNTPGAWGWKHVLMGVSVENQQTANERIPLLLQVPAAVRFLSCEPLLGPVDLSFNVQFEHPDNEGYGVGAIKGIDWCIVGGESGHGARPMHPHWAQSLRDQCQQAGVSYFFKQWGEWVECGQEPIPIAGNQVRNVRNILPDGSEYKTGYIRAGDLACMKLVGKKKSGRQLDGREWNEFPVSGKREPAEDPDLYAGGFDY